MAEMSLEQQRALAMANARMRAAGDEPAAQPKSTGQKLKEIYGGATLAPYQIIQSIVEAGAKGTDALGVTNDIAPIIHRMFKEDNESATPGLREGSGYTRAGNIGGQIAASLPLMALKPFQGAGMMAAAGNGAIQGATSGAMFSSENGDIAGSMTNGALFGGGLGGAANAVGRVGSAIIAPALPPLSKGLNYVRSLVDNAGITTSDLRSVAASGKPFTSAEAIGPRGEYALGALARRDGQTATALGNEMAARGAAQPDRMLADYATAAGVHPSAALGDLESFVSHNQKAADPLYRQAFAANPSIASPEIDRILETPAGRKALSAARDLMQNDQSLMGVSSPDLLEQAREAGQEIPWKGGVADGLKLRSLDYVKRALGDQVSAAYRAGNKTEGNILAGLKGRLVTALDNADATAAAGPNSMKAAGGLYKQARAKAGEYLSAQEQFANGQDFILSPKVTAKQMADHLADLGPADAHAFKGGVANKLFNVAQNGRLSPRMFSAPSVRGKLEAVLGPDKAQDFIANMQREAQMADFARRQSPGAGSGTAGWQAAMAEQDAGATAIPLDVLQAGITTMTHGPGPAAAGFIGKRLNGAASRWATRGMPVEARDAAGNLLLMPPDELATTLETTPPYGVLGSLGQARGVLADALRGGTVRYSPNAGLLAPFANSNPNRSR
jgi:hypothetical protein